MTKKPEAAGEIKKSEAAKLPFVKVKKTGQIGLLTKNTKEFVVVFLRNGKWKTFQPHEIEKYP